MDREIIIELEYDCITNIQFAFENKKNLWAKKEALTGVWGNMETRAFISGNKGNFWGKGNIGNQDFDFGKQGNKDIYFRETREQVPLPSPWRASHTSRYIIHIIISKSVYYSCSVEFLSCYFSCVITQKLIQGRGLPEVLFNHRRDYYHVTRFSELCTTICFQLGRW